MVMTGLCANGEVFRSRIYVDNRLHHMLALNIGRQSFWDRGDFPQVINNGSDYIALRNPWVNGSTIAPFDRRTFVLLATPGGRRLIRRAGDSLLSGSQRRRWWYEWVVPGWFRR